ncbi:plasma membrane calcium-transporting ATPase [Rhypophila decipiens]
MASSKEDPQAGEPPALRPRAPTITIDPVNMASPQPNTQESINSRPSQDEAVSPTTTSDPMASSWSASHQRTSSRPEMQPSNSFDSRDSRPTSPHNRANERAQGFLAVPNSLGRTRQDSVTTDDGHSISTASQTDTYAGGASFSGEKKSSSFNNNNVKEDENALKPDVNKEEDFVVQDNPFAFTPGQLNKMFSPKSLSAFWALGGLAGLEKGLRTDRKSGLSIDEVTLDGQVTFDQATSRSHEKALTEGVKDESSSSPLAATTSRASHAAGHHAEPQNFSSRKRVFKDNRLPERKGKTLLQLMWITYNDKVLMLLSAAAVVSLAIGLYETFGVPPKKGHEEESKLNWVEGVAIIAAIAIVVLVGSLNDWQKERQFAKLNKKKQDRVVKVVRSGKIIEISIFDLLVGDVLHLEPGDMIPVDGVLIEGYNVKCDESQATGESDIIKKQPADVVYAAIENNENLKKMDPFIQSGARVMEGVGTFLVTSTGVYSSYGKTLMSLNEDPEMTPLQSKLNVIAEYIAKLGGAAGLLLFIVLFIKFLVQLPKLPPDTTPSEKGMMFVEIFIVVVTIIVVAVPEGLPLAVTLALAFATTRMIKDNNLVRHLKACEVMGNATTICSDKTGTLTQNKMLVIAGTLGTTHRFDDGTATNRSGDETPESPVEQAVSAPELVSSLAEPVKDLVKKSISLNSTAFEGDVDGVTGFIGSKTETALLIFAREHLAMGPVSEERANAQTLHLFPFDSGRKCMGIVAQLPDGKARLYVKGASEIMLEKCTQVIRDPSQGLTAAPLTDDNRDAISHLIETYARRSLRTIGIIYRDFDRWPPRTQRRGDGDKEDIPFDDVCKNMVFVGMVGIKDPLRPGVPEAVRDCQRAGVIVRMVTGDNKITAEAIAHDCGILQHDSIVMEGPEFRNMTKAQQNEIIPRLHVLARSSPEDKRILVRRLKDLGETVAVTGDGTNDAPALKLADVGFSMGIAGTEVAKEASAIILMDDNFNSIVKALKWGRAVNDAVKRFLQFQLTVNITAVILTFVTAVSRESVFTAVQLLWVNLIMDTLAALALATDPPHESVLDRKPERRGSSIISTTMWKMIFGQAIYQLLITFLLFYGSPGILPDYDEGLDEVAPVQIKALVFNTFVWMQIFNQWNNRRLDNKFNIFEGLFKNWYFVCISTIMCAAQILIMFFGSTPFSLPSGTGPLKQTPAMWAYAIFLGFLSIPVGIIIRLVPDALLERLVPGFLKRRNRSDLPGLTVSDDEERVSYYPTALADVHDQLTFLKRMKGGRLNNLKFAMAHPRETFMPKKTPSHSRTNSKSNSINIPQTPTREDSFGKHSPAPTPDSRTRTKSNRSRSNSVLGAATVMSGIVAGSIAAGWSPIERRAGDDFDNFPRPSNSGLRDNGSNSQSDSQPSGRQPSFSDEPQQISESSSNVPILSMPKPPSPAAGKKA